MIHVDQQDPLQNFGALYRRAGTAATHEIRRSLAQHPFRDSRARGSRNGFGNINNIALRLAKGY